MKITEMKFFSPNKKEETDQILFRKLMTRNIALLFTLDYYIQIE